MSSPAINTSCHCGANKYSFPVTLPLSKEFTDIHICLCNACRLQTGTPCGTFVKSPTAPFDPDLPPPPTIKVYKSSDIASRYFCKTCGSQLFFRYSLPELCSGESLGFWLASGSVELPEGEKFGIDYVGFVKETKDGGIAGWLIDQGLKITRSFKGDLSSEDIQALEATAMSLEVPQSLEGRCHCSNIKITLSRQAGKPEELPPNTWSDNTDLVIPEWTPQEKKPPVDEKNPWWIRDALEPGMGKRFLGGLCTCNSCRKVAGVEVQSWLFVPTMCIQLTIPGTEETTGWPTRGELTDLEGKWKDIIGVYQSTPGNPGVLRGFCKNCGASLFWDGLTRRNFVDLSGGLFSSRGVKEEGWVEWWTERVSYVEDGENRGPIGKLLENGLKLWKARSE
ncbi:hypothetical protein ABW19_dt0204472 [Dactylella cylindrospora]|nr:hypothetical protein ABW19_dt0204472 [Dactylella cylindrospora]